MRAHLKLDRFDGGQTIRMFTLFRELGFPILEKSKFRFFKNDLIFRLDGPVIGYAVAGVGSVSGQNTADAVALAAGQRTDRRRGRLAVTVLR